MRMMEVLMAVLSSGLSWEQGSGHGHVGTGSSEEVVRLDGEKVATETSVGSGKCSRSAWAAVAKSLGRRLRAESYDQTRLPSSAGVNVSLSFLVQEISSLSELRSDFQLDILYDELWTDQRLRFSSRGLCRNNFSLQSDNERLLWRPDTCVVNSKAAQIHQSPSNNSFVVLHDSGLLWASYRMRLEAPCRLDLTMFPFDSQTCLLQFESYSLSAEEVRLDWASSEPIGFLSEVRLPDFRLVGWRVRRRQLAYPNGLWDRLEADFVFQRLYGYYFVQAYFPTILTVLCSWLTFLLEARSVSARLSLSVSSLLALTFQLATVTEELPRVSYLKCVDVWLFACILSIFSVNLEVAAVACLCRHERARQVGADLIHCWLEHLREAHPRHLRLEPDDVRRNLRRRSAVALSSVSSPPPDPAPLARPESLCSSRRASEPLEDPAPLFAASSWRFRWAECGQSFAAFFGVVLSGRPGRWWAAARALRWGSETLDRISMVAFPLLFALFNLSYWSFIVYRFTLDTSHQNLHFV